MHCRVELLQKIHKAQAAVQGRKFIGISKEPPHLFWGMLRVPAPHRLVEVGNFAVFVKILTVAATPRAQQGVAASISAAWALARARPPVRAA